MKKQKESIHAVIGVRHRGNSTYYVKRSLEMANYPGVWSLLSIQYKPYELPDPKQIGGKVDELFRRMSDERLGGVQLQVMRYLTSGASGDNPMGVDVGLHLYEIALPEEPRLNARYYTEAAWLRPEEYEDRCADRVCGLCLRLWADYAWLTGLSDRPFMLPSARSTDD
jgi:hypothetical protein